MSVNSYQVDGSHYKLQKMQHWDLAFGENLNYFVSAATKYIERWKSKNGLVDLNKALHYLLKEKENHSDWDGVSDTKTVLIDEYLSARPEFDDTQKRLFETLVKYERVSQGIWLKHKDDPEPDPDKILDEAIQILSEYINEESGKQIQ